MGPGRTYPHQGSCGILCIKVLSEPIKVPSAGSASQMKGEKYSEDFSAGVCGQVRQYQGIGNSMGLQASGGLGDNLPSKLMAALPGRCPR